MPPTEDLLGGMELLKAELVFEQRHQQQPTYSGRHSWTCVKAAFEAEVKTCTVSSLLHP